MTVQGLPIGLAAGGVAALAALGYQHVISPGQPVPSGWALVPALVAGALVGLVARGERSEPAGDVRAALRRAALHGACAASALLLLVLLPVIVARGEPPPASTVWFFVLMALLVGGAPAAALEEVGRRVGPTAGVTPAALGRDAALALAVLAGGTLLFAGLHLQLAFTAEVLLGGGLASAADLVEQNAHVLLEEPRAELLPLFLPPAAPLALLAVCRARGLRPATALLVAGAGSLAVLAPLLAPGLHHGQPVETVSRLSISCLTAGSEAQKLALALPVGAAIADALERRLRP